MNCQHCHQRPASVQLRMKINNNKESIHLCQQCLLTLEKQHQQNPNAFYGQMMGGQSGAVTQQQTSQESLLESLATDLTDQANAGAIDPVIGRHDEIQRVIEVLNRRNKNNPVLIGEPGVGKTAIAEGIALRIADKNVPNKLLNKRVMLLDVASLVSNTGIRGQFEERMKQLVDEIQSRDDILLFVDEIHLLVGAGQTQDSQMDAGNILKPALARGKMQLIGATTLKEYRAIEKDAALERRFQPVIVDEPTEDEAVAILQGLQQRYEEYHRVLYTEDAIKASVQLSKRYIQDRQLPDKAIDLMDEAGSVLNLSHEEKDENQIEHRLTDVRKEKEEATANEAYERAAQLRDEEKRLLEQKQHATSDIPEVTREVIEQLIQKKTGIPVSRLEEDEQTRMKELEMRLSQQVIGQVEAVQKVAKAVKRSRAGLTSKHRPSGSFLFVGPTGVGKTELSKSLARELFGDEDALIRLDMSEYMEKHAVSKLIGSPPGYVGHDEAGQLTEKIRRQPYSIVLLDEIEKAHPDVQHMFLQIMEDGRLTDSQGRTVSFKNTILIMTSNAGTQVKTLDTLGFSTGEEMAQESQLLSSLGDYFKPEFLNRFDSIVSFNALERDHLVDIVGLMLDTLKDALSEKAITLRVTDVAKEIIADLGDYKAFGARPLRRAIQEHVEDAIADLLVEAEVSVTSILVDAEEGKLSVQATT
ncbi:ATP-dependent Clp protease ATP-binding subunit [Aureibacillus halotolerans]|uniref:ATP-dependent Clp protease ATP-binding subunit ClpE n=1 Tax=Aureibacillus halotolerans TaxID=1508390 RepID=A0A4R6U908_9BACI|nr:ATP-dependent Clp protease ATP-binding subunit [Aureibacillus halotolerans]TDQ42242.1 ATP-dependent Clp protease ATP-binding subunit ClpE [Aureibacillus halotolerans]